MPELEIHEHVALGPLTTLGIGGAARWFAQARSEAEVEAAVVWTRERDVPLFVLGGGSNLLVHDEGFRGLVLHMNILGVELCGKDILEVGAGENWDKLVDFAVERGLAGMECLAGIPGSVGGTPVQNVGAYGQEVAETVLQVRAYDLVQNQWVGLDKLACRFRYRESLFNVDKPGRYIVARVSFQLRAGGKATLRYAELARRLEGRPEPSPAEVACMVRSIRQSKGMLLVDGDPDCRSAGSFFKNPMLAASKLTDVARRAGIRAAEVPHWPATDGQIKLPAAWLMERSGFHKGWGEGAAGLSSKHPLAVVNRGGATFADVARLEASVVAGVEEKFGIRLEREPVIL